VSHPSTARAELLSFLKCLWPAPLTILAIPIGLLYSLRPRRYGRAIIFERPHRGSICRRKMYAFTIGHVIIASGPMPRFILEHELVHVVQYEHWGPFYPLGWVIGSLVALVRFRKPYSRNPFEAEALAVEARVRLSPPELAQPCSSARLLSNGFEEHTP